MVNLPIPNMNQAKAVTSITGVTMVQSRVTQKKNGHHQKSNNFQNVIYIDTKTSATNVPALQAHLDPAGKVLDDPPSFLPWDRTYCCCDCCLQVRDRLGAVAIHPVLKVSPQIKIWWIW